MRTTRWTKLLRLQDYSTVWDWIVRAVVPAVYANKHYNAEEMMPYERNFMAQYNRVVGGMFLIQTRGLRRNSGEQCGFVLTIPDPEPCSCRVSS